MKIPIISALFLKSIPEFIPGNIVKLINLYNYNYNYDYDYIDFFTNNMVITAKVYRKLYFIIDYFILIISYINYNIVITWKVIK
jgi:hypothetical protein